MKKSLKNRNFLEEGKHMILCPPSPPKKFVLQPLIFMVLGEKYHWFQRGGEISLFWKIYTPVAVRTVLSGAFFGHSGGIVPSESFDVTLAAV